MIFKQYCVDGLSQLSYLIGDTSSGRAVVVDPQRDIAVYRHDAETYGLRIERVIETHCHADFLSGHLELAATGATICFGAGTETDYPIELLHDGERIDLGQVTLEIRATPGHTSESICIVVYEHCDCAVPYAVLTGDTLLIGDVGRPDLSSSAETSSTTMAHQLYRSVYDKLLTLPDQTRVYPAHGAGSPCARHLSVETSSTIGEQRRTNHALALCDEAGFVAAVTAGQPPAPPYFSFASRRNCERRPLLDAICRPLPISFTDFESQRSAGAVLLDARDPAEFADCHVRGSLNVGLDGRFAEYVGSVLRPDQRVVLICPPGREVEATIQLAQIGYDNVVGYLDNPHRVFAEHPDAIECSSRLTAAELAQRRADAGELVVVDVRNPGELANGVIPGAIRIPLAQLVQRACELDRSCATAVYCAGGYRSMIAASWLTAAGFLDVCDLVGGYDAWATMPLFAATAS
jgi:glyoxylase-like metal-dependent hydrolase (beta-lactamase superfamily II)/rhodanese-related sulfurtransferase